MCESIELRANRRIDFRHAMAVHVAPQTRHAVQISIAVAVDQVHSVGVGDHQRLEFVPQLHRREWMPDVLLIELAELLRGHG